MKIFFETCALVGLLQCQLQANKVSCVCQLQLRLHVLKRQQLLFSWLCTSDDLLVFQPSDEHNRLPPKKVFGRQS